VHTEVSGDLDLAPLEAAIERHDKTVKIGTMVLAGRLVQPGGGRVLFHQRP
jgi:hypothetical protein